MDRFRSGPQKENTSKDRFRSSFKGATCIYRTVFSSGNSCTDSELVNHDQYEYEYEYQRYWR